MINIGWGNVFRKNTNLQCTTINRKSGELGGFKENITLINNAVRYFKFYYLLKPSNFTFFLSSRISLVPKFHL